MHYLSSQYFKTLSFRYQATLDIILSWYSTVVQRTNEFSCNNDKLTPMRFVSLVSNLWPKILLSNLDKLLYAGKLAGDFKKLYLQIASTK